MGTGDGGQAGRRTVSFILLENQRITSHFTPLTPEGRLIKKRGTPARALGRKCGPRLPPGDPNLLCGRGALGSQGMTIHSWPIDANPVDYPAPLIEVGPLVCDPLEPDLVGAYEVD